MFGEAIITKFFMGRKLEGDYLVLLLHLIMNPNFSSQKKSWVEKISAFDFFYEPLQSVALTFDMEAKAG